MWGNLLQIQSGLSEKINQRFKIKHDASHILDVWLALRVELAEFANETRCFKHWSVRGPSDKETRLEEWVDALHFYLSLFNMYRVTEKAIDIEVTFVMESENQGNYKINDFHEDRPLSYWLNKTFDSINTGSALDEYSGQCMALQSFKYFFKAAIKSGFTLKDIESAYLRKNKINYERQEAGY